ncbi:MAG TPA: hypothetical protein VHL10_09440, partial [Nitrososphaera sp.]|nr:hypothetical protein [Nitrososphaera sp.]
MARKGGRILTFQERGTTLKGTLGILVQQFLIMNKLLLVEFAVVVGLDPLNMTIAIQVTKVTMMPALAIQFSAPLCMMRTGRGKEMMGMNMLEMFDLERQDVLKHAIVMMIGFSQGMKLRVLFSGRFS